MTQLTKEQLKVIADYEALCREIMPANMTCIDYAIGDGGRTYGYMHYESGCILFQTFQQGLDDFSLKVPNECELAKLKVEKLESDLAAAKAKMDLVCNV